MEAVKKKQLEAQLEAAEKLFAAGDLRRARMHVDMAVAMDRSGACPEAQRASAAYRVLAAANSNKADHYGVLGVAAPPGGRPTKESHDAVQSQHKGLCDMFEADKSSAAVASALKLVKQAFAALTDIRKNEGVVPGRTPARRHRLPPLLPVPRAKAKRPPRRCGWSWWASSRPWPIILLPLSSWTSRWRRSRRGTTARWQMTILSRRTVAFFLVVDGEDDDEDEGGDDAGHHELDLHVLVPHPAADVRALGPEIQGMVMEPLGPRHQARDQSPDDDPTNIIHAFVVGRRFH